MASIVHNSIGSLFNFPLRIGGMILLFIGLAITLTLGWGILAGLFIAAVGGYFAFTSTGIDIDFDNKAVRNYTRFYGIKRGRWNEYPTYPFLCIIRKERKRAYSEEAALEAENPYQFEIYILSRSHRGKTLLCIAYSREKAEKIAASYAAEMNLELVEYNPPGKAKKRTHERKSRKHSGYRDTHADN